MQAYCMKCRTKRELKEAKAITIKNGKPATRGDIFILLDKKAPVQFGLIL